MESLHAFENLIDEFKKLPKPEEPQATYLGICKYPQSRFEEVCSRLLSFYFYPNEEHGLGTLFLDSLLECIEGKKYEIDKSQITVKTEIKTKKGNRIDILIRGLNFTIGIENKIYACLYNDLADYREKINEIGGTNIAIVLSVRELNPEELKKVKEEGFHIIYYSKFLKTIERKLAPAIIHPNHLIFVKDFIQTLNNMNNETNLTEGLKYFFSKNEREIETLWNNYGLYKNEVIQKIEELRKKISKETEEWWGWYEDFDVCIGYNKFYVEDHQIGIVGEYFRDVENSSSWNFRIEIMAWNSGDWEYFRSDIFMKFQNDDVLVLKEDGNKKSVIVYSMQENNQSEVVEKLKEYYNKLNELVEKKKGLKPQLFNSTK